MGGYVVESRFGVKVLVWLGEGIILWVVRILLGFSRFFTKFLVNFLCFVSFLFFMVIFFYIYISYGDDRAERGFFWREIVLE